MNRRKRIYRRWLIAALCVTIIFSLVYSFFWFEKQIPGKIYLQMNEEGNFSFGFPFTVSLADEDREAAWGDLSDIPPDKINMTGGQEVRLKSSETGDFRLNLKLFGLFTCKTIEVEVTEEIYLYPSGRPVGIFLETDGVMVIGTSELMTNTGEPVSPAEGLIKSGDYILAADGIMMEGKEELSEYLKGCKETVTLTIRRNGEISNISVDPVCCEDGVYRTGIWVRDDAHGIGTLTYVSSEGEFGSLGHGISDADTGKVVEIGEGGLYQAKVRDVLKGRIGMPGSLIGSIEYNMGGYYGEINKNTKKGVFGKMDGNYMDVCEKEALPVGYRNEIKEGKARIICTVDGKTDSYEIEITRINMGSEDNKSMMIKVTDERLIELTGGIVQGMSGSPIIQDGKLVGAVTHVLVNDPTRGYGIFIENMLDVAE